MTQEFNPYTNQNENAQPQPPFNQQPAEPVKPLIQQPQQPVQQPAQPPVQPQFQNRQPYPPQFTAPQNTPYNNNTEKKSGAAKGFGVVSFIIGCFALIITSMIYFNFHTTVSQKYSYALTWSLIVGLPALIFGVVSLMKKTDKKLFPILGIAFAVVLMLCAFITYFVMVNAVPASQIIRY